MSAAARAAEGLLRLVVRPVLGPPVPLAAQRAFLEALMTPAGLPRGTAVVRSPLGGRPAEVVTAPGAAGDPVLLVHGGAFVTCSPRTHRTFAVHLSAAVGAPVHVLDQRRAPEHPYPAALDDTVAALRALGPDTRLVGDSAGGWLALSALLRLREEGGPLPVRAALVSPVVDLTLASSSAWAGREPLVRRDWVELGVRSFLAGHPAGSLLDADLTGLPPLLVQVSEHERLRPEGEELARRAGARLQVLPGLWHDPHVLAGLVPEAADAVRSLGDWLRG